MGPTAHEGSYEPSPPVIANARPAPPIAAGLRQSYQDPDPLRARSASRSPAEMNQGVSVAYTTKVRLIAETDPSYDAETPLSNDVVVLLK